MKRAKPPFRADHVGSLLRPAPLKAAREKHAKGEIGATDLKAIEDREIERVIKKQEEVGLQAVTDGEFRRSWWHLDFLWGLDGVERHVMDTGIAFAGVTTRNEGVRVTRKLGFSSHPMIEHFKFVQAHTTRTPKITIPAPSPTWVRPTARRCVPSLMPAVAICSSMKYSSPCCAIPNTASRWWIAGMIPSDSERFTAISSTSRCRIFLPI